MPRPKHWLPLVLGALGIGTLIMLETNLDPRRAKVVSAALSRVGVTDPSEFWSDTLPGLTREEWPKDWCGGFALWAIHQAGLGTELDWKIGKGFLIPNLTQTKLPEPGDIAYFNHNEHHSVVTAVNADGTVSLVSGNGAGGQVTFGVSPKSSVTAFFSLTPLLKSFFG